MNQWIEGEERPSVRCVCGFFLAPLNALHGDRDGFSARPQQQRLHAGSDNRRLPLPVCTSTRKIRVSDIHSTTLSGSRRPSGMPWIFHRWMICFEDYWYSYSLGDCVVSMSARVSTTTTTATSTSTPTTLTTATMTTVTTTTTTILATTTATVTASSPGDV